MDFVVGLGAALIVAGGAYLGVQRSGRYAHDLEQERWSRAREDSAEDARAGAITELTEHLASALQTITWFTAGAKIRAQVFSEQSIIDYDSEMRAHLTGTIQGLVAVAHRDEAAFRALERLASEVWALDFRVASDAASYWSDREDGRTKISGSYSDAVALERSFPQRIVDVLRRHAGAEGEAVGPGSRSSERDDSKLLG